MRSTTERVRQTRNRGQEILPALPPEKIKIGFLRWEQSKELFLKFIESEVLPLRNDNPSTIDR
jgi:hypothetical protein